MPKFHFTTDEADAIVTAVMLPDEGAGAPRRPEAALRRRAVRGEGPAAGAQLQLPGLPPDRREGRHLPRHHRGPAREPRAARCIQAQALSPPILYNDKSKIGEGSRVQTDWLHGFLRQPGEQDPALAPGAHAHLRVRRGRSATPSPTTSPPRTRCPIPTSPSPRATPALLAAGRDLFGQLAVREVPRGGGQAAQPGPGEHGARPRQGARAPARGLARPVAGRPGAASRPAPACRRTSRRTPQENAFPEILGGDQKKQIEAVRTYLLSLGSGNTGTGRGQRGSDPRGRGGPVAVSDERAAAGAGTTPRSCRAT